MSHLPCEFLQSLVALGSREEDQEDILWIGTGVLYGYIPPKETHKGYPYIATNRHLLSGLKTLYLRFNPSHPGLRARQFACPLLDRRGKQLWLGHPDPEIDVAVLPFDFTRLRVREKLDGLLLSSRQSSLRLSDMRLNVSEGDEVFVLGFPLGAVGEFRNAPVVRRGCVAQIQELYSGHSDSYLVDAQVYPGNSGGPVVLAERTRLPWDVAQSKAGLIGLAHAYLAFQDVASSQQTGHPRVFFEENTGLTEVYPVDAIDQTIQAHLRSKHKKARTPRKKRAKHLGGSSTPQLAEEAELALCQADPGPEAQEAEFDWL